MQKMLKEQQPQTYCHVKHTTQTPEIKKKKFKLHFANKSC